MTWCLTVLKHVDRNGGTCFVRFRTFLTPVLSGMYIINISRRMDSPGYTGQYIPENLDADWLTPWKRTVHGITEIRPWTALYDVFFVSFLSAQSMFSFFIVLQWHLPSPLSMAMYGLCHSSCGYGCGGEVWKANLHLYWLSFASMATRFQCLFHAL